MPRILNGTKHPDGVRIKKRNQAVVCAAALLLQVLPTAKRVSLS
jgi:hypothetical protein